MSSLKPPKGYKRRLCDHACQNMAERALPSPLGHEALDQVDQIIRRAPQQGFLRPRKVI